MYPAQAVLQKNGFSILILYPPLLKYNGPVGEPACAGRRTRNYKNKEETDCRPPPHRPQRTHRAENPLPLALLFSFTLALFEFMFRLYALPLPFSVALHQLPLVPALLKVPFVLRLPAGRAETIAEAFISCEMVPIQGKFSQPFTCSPALRRGGAFRWTDYGTLLQSLGWYCKILP